MQVTALKARKKHQRCASGVSAESQRCVFCFFVPSLLSFLYLFVYVLLGEIADKGVISEELFFLEQKSTRKAHSGIGMVSRWFRNRLLMCLTTDHLQTTCRVPACYGGKPTIDLYEKK